MIKKILFIITLLIIGVAVFLYTTDIPLTGEIIKQTQLEKTISFMEKNNITLHIKSECKPCEKQANEFEGKLDKAIKKGVIVDCTNIYKNECYGVFPKWTYNGKTVAGGYIATENIESIFTKIIEKEKFRNNSTS